MSTNLPDTARAQGMGNRDAQTVRSGTWWRLVGSVDSISSRKLIPGALPPEDPITLLVTDVRIHDGEMHSVHMAYHPAWGKGGIAILAEEFLVNFAEETVQEAEARREREIAALMARTSDIALQIRSGPPQEDILQISSEISARKTEEAEKAEAMRLKEEASQKAEKKARDDGLSYHESQQAGREAWHSVPDRVPLPRSSAGLVPVSLLPSGDIVAVQNRINGEIIRMEAVQQWISARADEMNKTMGVVAAYQTEKVSAMTSSISEKTKQAQGMLRNVATMKLFLGEEIDTWKVTEGKSADPDRKLHLMQTMLYLDEEIIVEDLFGKGLRHTDLSRLPDLLSENPDLVRRMMPHDRCVAIAKVRRHGVEITVPEGMTFGETYSNVMRQIGEVEADKRIFILIRDGENVNVVIADEHTSKAERLFPSKAEIDKIYTGSFDRREITPQDIEYSDKRNKHDDRALFYKRFLITLWGLHEREGIFGDFFPKGMNWLEESVASDRFVFVHDEENVLTSGRESVHDYIARGINDLRPGSEVMIDTRLALTEDSAPTAYRESQIRGRWEKDRYRHPKDRYLHATVLKSGDQLIVQVPTVSGYQEREVNTPLIVRTEAGKSPEGVLNLGGVTSAKIRGYMNSRLERQSYLSWFGMFATALPLIEERERVQAKVMSRIMSAGDISEEHAMRSLSLFRESVRGGRLPESDAEVARVTLNARTMANAGKFDKEGVIGVRMHAGGKVARIYAAPERVPGVLVREVVEERGGERSLAPFSLINPRGEALIMGYDRMVEHLGMINQKSIPGLSLQRDWEAASPDPSGAIGMLERGEITEDMALEAGNGFIRVNNASRTRKVVYETNYLPVGAIAFQERRTNNGRWDSVTSSMAFAYGIIHSPLTEIINAGYEDIARRAINKLCNRDTTDRIIRNLRGNDDIRFACSRVGERLPMSKVILGPSDDSTFYRVRNEEGDPSSDPIVNILMGSMPGDDLKQIVSEEGRSALVTFCDDALIRMHEAFLAPKKEPGDIPSP